MANGGSIEVDVKITGYWQTCPVCSGRGQVRGDFYTGVPTTAMHTFCRRCAGTGTVEVPVVASARKEQP